MPVRFSPSSSSSRPSSSSRCGPSRGRPARTEPRDLPVGLAGPPAAVAPVERQLDRGGGSFEIRRYGDEAAAREAIERREIYGAVVVTPKGPHALTASAAAPVVAQALQGAVGGQPAAGSASPHVTDVVAAPDVDPRGAGLSSSVLPLAIGGVAAGAMVTVGVLRKHNSGSTDGSSRNSRNSRNRRKGSRVPAA